MIYSFSPNWYKPQCLHFSQQHLYFCSNYLLYRYDLPRKRIDQELCLRRIAMQHQINHKDIKINAISSIKQFIIVAINQPYLVFVNKLSMAFQTLVPINNFIAEYIHSYQFEGQQHIVLCSKDGALSKFMFQKSQNNLMPIQAKFKSSSLKIIYSIQKHHLAIFTRGTILVFNQAFTKLQKMVEVGQNHTIFSVDYLQKDKEIHFCLLTKSNESHVLTLFELDLQKQFPLEHKKKIEEIANNIRRFEIDWHYPNKFSQKLKNNLKASMSIKLLPGRHVVVTGKLGDVVTLDVQEIEEGSCVKIKPYSYEIQNQQKLPYQVWNDSKHYKEIYWIYKHQGRLYMVSTDHNLSIWQLANNNSHVKFIYSIKFLTAAVHSFFYSELDPRNVFALLKDSAIRCFTPLDESSHQINQFWKFSKKFTIKKAVGHPYEEGLLALITQCNKIQLYDVYEDRLMKLIHFQEQILNISFEHPSIKGEIQSMFSYEFQPHKLHYVSHLAKQTQKSLVLMVQTKSSLLLLNNMTLSQFQCLIGRRQRRLERIHQNRYWDQVTLVCSAMRKTCACLLVRHKGRQVQLEEQLSYNQGKVMFKMLKDSNQLTMFNFKGNKISIKRCQLQSQEKPQFANTTQLYLDYPIDYLNLNYSDQRMAVYSLRSDVLIIINAQPLKAASYHINAQTDYSQLYTLNSKIETFCFYFENHLIVATRDQSIKIFDIRHLQLLNTNSQKNKLGSSLAVKNAEQPNAEQKGEQNKNKATDEVGQKAEKMDRKQVALP